MSALRSLAALFSTLLLLGSSPALLAQQPTLQLDQSSRSVDLADYTYHLLDPQGLLDIGDVTALEFAPLPEGEINFGFTEDKIWLRTHLQNMSSENLSRILQTSARFMRPLEIYLQHQDGSVEQLLYNDETLPFGDRPMPELRFLATEFSLAAREDATLYIRFGAGGQATMALSITNYVDALTEQFSASVTTAIFCAVIVTLILVNLFHYIAVRKLAYLVYIFYEAFNIIYITHIDGFTFQYLWPDWPQWNDDATPIIASVGLIVGNYFAMVFLRAPKYSVILYRFYQLFIAISFLSLLITLLGGNRVGNQFSASLLPLSFLLSVITAAVVLRRGHYLARYFLVAWGLFGIMGIVWSGSILGFLQVEYNLITLYKSTIAAQALILSMGLADQVRRINNQYNQTQAELIESLEGRLEDARERIQLEKKNEQTMSRLLEKSRQFASTSHDINQPIQSLRLAIKALQVKSGDSSATAQLESTLNHMENILSGTLDEASDEFKKTSRESGIQAQVAGALIEDVYHQFTSLATERNLKLKYFNSNSIFVGWQTPLKRCLNNLVSNALNNTEKGGVLIGSRRRGDQLLFEVYDTGRGVPEQDAERLLQAHNKGEDSTGHGLGLAIVQEICTQYGWALKLRSVPGRGSCFSISVPVRVST